MDHVKTGAVLLVLLLVIAAVAVEIYRETHHFRVTRYDVSSKKLSGINLAYIDRVGQGDPSCHRNFSDPKEEYLFLH